MKATELIAELQKILQEHGDFEVVAPFSPSYSRLYWEPVTTAEITVENIILLT